MDSPNIVEDFNGGIPNSGQYASKNAISTIKELRGKLAVKEAWKQASNILTLRAYRVNGSNPKRIDVDSPSGLRMPSGNELGANEKWIPGGKTSREILEATVDQIQPGTFISRPAF